MHLSILLLASASVIAAQTAIPNLPLSFERHAQNFHARAGTHNVWLSPQAITLQSGHSSLRLGFAHASRTPSVETLDPLPGKTNYITGSDPKHWTTGLPTYGRVRYKQLYPGIDLICHGSSDSFEYDFEVRPGANPARIRLSFDPAYKARLEPGGDLVFSGGGREWRQHAPGVYQGTRTIAARYHLSSRGEFGFELGAYDRAKPLVIDPVVVQATYLGGTRSDTITAMAVDADGNIYLTGTTNSVDFPVTSNGYKPQYTGGPCATTVPPFGTFETWCTNVFVTKLNPTGTALVYSTYVGGSGSENPLGGDTPAGIALDSQGNAYVTGSTYSADFPVTSGALQSTSTGTAGFLFQLDPSGSNLLYSTYIGNADDQAKALAVSDAGVLYLTGTTRNAAFPVLNAMQSQFQKGDCSGLVFYNGGGPVCSYAFLMQWHVPDITLNYSTFLGGSSDDAANGVATDAAGNAYVTGFTLSADFPLVNPIQSVPGGGPCLVSATLDAPACSDAFVAKIDPSGTSIIYSTLLGGAGTDVANGIAVDTQGNAYVAGFTDSSSFPLVNAIQTTPGGGICYTPHGGPVPCDNAFVTKINPDGTALVYSTYLGGSGNTDAASIAVDAAGNAFIEGTSAAFAGFPVTADALLHCNGAGFSNFLTEIGPTGTLAYSTFLGGSALTGVPAPFALGGTGRVYFAGGSGPVTLPLAANATQSTLGSSYDHAYVAVLDLTAPPATGPVIDTGCVLNAGGYNSVINVSNPVAAVSPGEIVAIFGSGLGPPAGASAGLDSSGNFPTSVGGVTVAFNDTLAPLLYAGANQINAIVPFEIAGSQSVSVKVTYQGVSSSPVAMAVYSSVQGIFTIGSTGSGQAAALNQDGSYNSPSNPAPRGSIVSIWATGLGPTNPAYADGQITPLVLSPLVSQPTLYVHDAATIAELQYAGQAPGLVAGAVQINFYVPDSAPAGPAIPIFINYLTQPPTIAIK